jgi:hypothetical protein
LGYDLFRISKQLAIGNAVNSVAASRLEEENFGNQGVIK